jgi:MFS family permease
MTESLRRTAPGAQVERLADPRWRWSLIGIVCLITVVATEAMAVSTVMPLVEQDLGDIWLYGWSFSAFFLGNLVGIVVGGRSADRVAPVGPLLAGLGVFTAGLIVGGLAPTMAVLVLGRLLQGLGAGVVPAVAYVCVGRAFPASLRPRVFAVMSTAWILPSLLSPLAASAVATALGWRWVFLGLVPITGLVVLLAIRSLRSIGEPAGTDAPAAPIVLALRLAGGAALLLAGLTARAAWMAVALVAAGVVVAAPAFRALTPPGTLRAARGLPAAVLCRGILTFAFFSAQAFLSLAMTSVRGRSTLEAGLVLAAASLTWTAGSWLQARRIDAWGAARLERLGGAVLAAGLVGMALCLSDLVPVWCWFVASAVAGLGTGTAYSPLSVVTLAEAEPGREGAASSALQLTDVLGIAVGTGVAGAIVAVGDRIGSGRAGTLGVLFAVSAAVALVLVALSGRLERRLTG